MANRALAIMQRVSGTEATERELSTLVATHYERMLRLATLVWPGARRCRGCGGSRT